MNTRIKPVRSFLFVPGNKESMLDKAAQAGADALILDLEDSVPSPEKTAARELVAKKIPELIAQNQRIWVRINRTAHIYDLDDILAVAPAGIEGIYISKPGGPEDVYMASCMIAEAEARANLPLGSIGLIPLLETARSMQLCYDIAQMPRVGRHRRRHRQECRHGARAEIRLDCRRPRDRILEIPWWSWPRVRPASRR